MTKPSFSVGEIAKRLGGTSVGDESTQLTGFAPADSARPGDLTFAENEEYFQRAEEGAASAILVAEDYISEKKALIKVKNARVAFASVLPMFFPESSPTPGIHASAVVGPGAVVDEAAWVGPGCVIEDGAHIGARTILEGGNFIGANARLGEDVRLFPNAVVYARGEIGDRVRIHAGAVIGADGFGYVLDAGAHKKVPQVGNVVVEADVEIGAGSTVDRGALGTTRIGRGTKIDNLVQIGHNVVLGQHCILCAQVGIAGSTQIGSHVVMGGQAGVAGHLKIGDDVTIAAQSGVMHNIPSGQKWFGSPAQPDRQEKRQVIALQRLPELLRRVKVLEEHLRE